MDKLIELLIKYRNGKIFGGLFHASLRLLSIEIPNNVKIGKNLSLLHGGVGVVLHPSTEIGDGVRIFQGVTLGRADVEKKWQESKMEKIIVENGVIICAGAKILCKRGVLTIGKNTIIGANAVLTKSTGENEIWAGVPAKKIGIREDIS
ncbi:MAG: serine acetyltransferase [Clostridium sp.]|nr:serine acetyltransferase [Clostridium sp.]